MARSCGCVDCSPTPPVATSSPWTPPAAASTVAYGSSSNCATRRAGFRGATPPPSKPTTSNAVHDGGATTGANAGGLCKRHNHVKEELGWYFTVRSTGLDGTGPHGIRIQTPTGRIHDSTAPPILGEGWSRPKPFRTNGWMTSTSRTCPYPKTPGAAGSPTRPTTGSRRTANCRSPERWLRPGRTSGGGRSGSTTRGRARARNPTAGRRQWGRRGCRRSSC